MSIIRGLIDVIGFLTIIPVSKASKGNLINTANHMYFFPVVGGFIGFLAGFFAWFLLTILPEVVVGVLTLGFILAFTGFSHIDGLLDFGDGLMVQGPLERKVKAMRDRHVGAGGVTLAFIVALTSAVCISQIPKNLIIQGLISSEVSAKLSMVILAGIGRSAYKGLGMYFVDAMHKHLWGIIKVVTALTISIIIVLLLLGVLGLTIILSAVVVSIILVAVSNRNFNGVTGDVFGAANEISRMISLLIVLMVV